MTLLPDTTETLVAADELVRGASRSGPTRRTISSSPNDSNRRAASR